MSRFIIPTQGTLTQGWGANPAFYAQFGQRGHNGLDLGNKTGTPVYASGDGTIHFEGWGQNNSWMGSVAGIAIIIDHGDVYTGYAHLQSTVINRGQRVTKGQLIGYMGATGTATGSHTHFEFIGKPTNTSNGFYGRVEPNQFLTGGTLMTPNFIRRTYLAVQGRNPSQGEVDFHMSNSNPESFINGFGENFLWRTMEAQRNALQADVNRLNTEKTALTQERNQLRNELASVKELNAQNELRVTELAKQVSELDAEILTLEEIIVTKEARIKELESQSEGKPLDDYSMGELLVAAFKKTFKIK